MSMTPPGYPPQMPQQMQPPPQPQAPPAGYSQPQQTPAPQFAPQPGYPAVPQPGPPAVAPGPFDGGTDPNVVNWAQLMQEAASAPGFEVLPIGDYDVIVEDADNVTSSTGKLMYKVKFKVTVGPHAGKIIMNQFVVSPDSANALSFFFKHMAVLGLDQAYFAQNPPPALIANHLVGRSCRVTIKHRTYQGALQMDVANVLPAGGVGAPMPQGIPVPQAGVPQGMAPPPQAPQMAPQQPQAAPQPMQSPQAPQGPPMAPQQAPPAQYPPQAPPAAPQPQYAPQPGQQPAPGQAPW